MDVKRFILQTGLFFLFLISLLFFFKTEIFAYKIEIDPPDSYAGQPSSAPHYLDPPCKGEEGCDNFAIPSENTETVYVTFDGLSKGEKYKYCLANNNDCNDLNDYISLKETAEIDSNGSLTFPLCADGKSKLKLAKDFDPKDTNDLKNAKNFHCSDKDFFWGQHTYRIQLFTEDNNLIEIAPIYIAHYYPQVILNDVPIEISTGDIEDENNSQKIEITPETFIKIQIKGMRRPFDNEGRNNYKVEVAREESSSHLWGYQCVTVKKDKGISEVANINNNPEGIKLPKGNYVLKINERINEGNPLHSRCNAGYSYYYIGFRVDEKESGITYVSVDPHGEDLKRVEKTYRIPPIPCVGRLDSSGCTKIKTAIGEIDTTPMGFVKSVFGLVLGAAGGLALLLIIYSGYMLIESRGNAEKLEAAREQLISAVIGLLFIIFSLVAVEIIGVDILNLPGFGR